jgi:hypothetical protein
MATQNQIWMRNKIYIFLDSLTTKEHVCVSSILLHAVVIQQSLDYSGFLVVLVWHGTDAVL